MTGDMLTVLTKLADEEATVATTPEPPAWKRWEVRDLATLRESGPLYKPSEWFGNGSPLPAAVETRYRRAVHRLAAEGLVELTHSEGGRLRHLKTTDAGRQALAAEQAESPPVTVGALPTAEASAV
ncbi:hypothetical protein [Limnoglobus roseus]|uniref:MarR family transcriptional regulator n=1 Tax=Limnoglobus roseus TaxID=2598579 RepID=A0A5C1ACV4_9BACT|nr:hypothetical protein [Limnoglobus roseus]QEL14944.1 hypothetical protein PX52LOC_01845 [Limnoglobus roseus]